MKGGGDHDSAAIELCEALLSAWAPALGDNPRRAYLADRERWLAAAGELLERHPRGRLQHALDYMLGDEILGSRALTLPDSRRSPINSWPATTPALGAAAARRR